MIYYGDEIGMGENIYLGDPMGFGLPCSGAPTGNAGFSRANPQKLYLPVIIDPEYHAGRRSMWRLRTNNLHSLLWWMRRVLALQKAAPGIRPRDA